MHTSHIIRELSAKLTGGVAHKKKIGMTDTTYDNSTELDPRIAARLKRDVKGLVAAVIQQYDTHEVLMVGYMNDEA